MFSTLPVTKQASQSFCKYSNVPSVLVGHRTSMILFSNVRSKHLFAKMIRNLCPHSHFAHLSMFCTEMSSFIYFHNKLIDCNGQNGTLLMAKRFFTRLMFLCNELVTFFSLVFLVFGANQNTEYIGKYLPIMLHTLANMNDCTRTKQRIRYLAPK